MAMAVAMPPSMAVAAVAAASKGGGGGGGCGGVGDGGGSGGGGGGGRQGRRRRRQQRRGGGGGISRDGSGGSSGTPSPQHAHPSLTATLALGGTHHSLELEMHHLVDDSTRTRTRLLWHLLQSTHKPVHQWESAQPFILHAVEHIHASYASMQGPAQHNARPDHTLGSVGRRIGQSGDAGGRNPADFPRADLCRSCGTSRSGNVQTYMHGLHSAEGGDRVLTERRYTPNSELEFYRRESHTTALAGYRGRSRAERVDSPSAHARESTRSVCCQQCRGRNTGRLSVEPAGGVLCAVYERHPPRQALHAGANRLGETPARCRPGAAIARSKCYH